MFSRQHFNAIAKDIRTELEPLIKERPSADNYHEIDAAIGALTHLALRFTKRFVDEREDHNGYEFDPLKFLDACSPNEVLYPLSELWEAYSK